MTTSKPTKRAPKRSGHATVVAADAASNIVGGPPGAGPTSPKGALALESPGSRAGSALEERPATALADPNSKVALLARIKTLLVLFTLISVLKVLGDLLKILRTD